MSNLHAYFALKNEQAFSKLLEATKSRKQPSAPSSSLGKRTLLSQDVDVNAKDWLGRTVLHLACSTVEPYALTYIRMLLAHPAINVNVLDTESKWTPLHRALYHGNLYACLLLLKRPDIDTQVRDNEGLTSFELYNLTQKKAWPLETGLSLPDQKHTKNLDLFADFFTWGSNRNATLGHGDNNDKLTPDHVIMPQVDELNGAEKFTLVQAKAVSMAKLHTTVITNEIGHNLRICGFGSGGRLGHTKHTLYNLQHVPQLPHHVTSVVAAQDHTLVLTNRGEVWSWGLNRFSQLGYVIESSTPGHGKSSEEPIQAVPRRVLGPLKKETVAGVAASKTASACWTSNDGDVFTWGTNNGQLGYDSSSQPVQIFPRKATGVQNVYNIAFTDSAMACLLRTGDVICFHDDIRFRVMFSVPNLSGFAPYIPPSASKSPSIVKVTGCEGTFAALSLKGDIWTFSVSGRLPSAPESGKDLKNKDRVAVKPQRVWTARRLGDSARDVALGANGDVIICTESGHVLTRSRTTSSTTTRSAGTTGAVVKGAFLRVPFIHRAIHVYANSAGGYGALRLNYPPQAVVIKGNTLWEDIGTIRPWASEEFGPENKNINVEGMIEDSKQDDDSEVDYTSRINTMRLLFLLTDAKPRLESKQGLSAGQLEYGSNMILRAGMDIPVHRALLAARSQLLTAVFVSERWHFDNGSIFIEYINCESEFSTTPSVLKICGVRSLTVLLLLEFFYTDTIPRLDILPFTDAVQIRREFNQLATALEIDYLFIIGDTGITVRSFTLGQHLWAIFDACQNGEDGLTSQAAYPDVFIDLMDRRIACHSMILRSRCQFFTYFFEEDAWTVNRWSPERTIIIDMQHMVWGGFFYVIKWIYSGEESTLFNNLEGLDTAQDLINLLFEVISISSELLLDRLMSVCSSILLRLVTISNAPSLLSRATHYNVLPIIISLQDYIACNLEATMESRLLDNVCEREHDVEGLVPALGTAIRSRRVTSSPCSHAGSDMDELMKRHADWLALQDIPGPIVRTQRPSPEQHSPRLMPTPGGFSLTTSKSAMEDCFFHMDEHSAITTTVISSPESSTSGGLAKKVWKSRTVHDVLKVDFKTVMAETAARTMSVATAASDDRNPFVDSSEVQLTRVISTTPPSSLQTSLPHNKATSRNMYLQGPSAIAPVAVSNSSQGHRSAISNPARSPINVEPVKPVSALSAASSTSPSSTKTPTTIRRRPNDPPAWSSKPLDNDLSFPVVGLSFTAIQQQQLSQVQSTKEKPTLRQIQEEERAKKDEEDFMKWWAAEEKRLAKKPEGGLEASLSARNTRTRKYRGKGLGQSSKDAG